MNFLKKNVKTITVAMLGVIIGMMITGGIVFATGQYNASDVKYDTTSVAGALDNLYNYAKNKSDLAEQMQKPNTWEIGKEYDFGDGIYGQRFEGEGSKKTGRHWVTFATKPNGYKFILSSGGYITATDNSIINPGIYAPDWYFAIEDFQYVYNRGDYGDKNYNIWILYTK